MSKLGEWIDGLSDYRKDRIVKAQGWGFQYAEWQQQVEDGDLPDDAWDPRHGRFCIAQHAGIFPVREIPQRFDALCRRFGLDRIVRACKARAAATMSSEVERAEEAVHG